MSATIPELAHPPGVVRLPHQRDVPLTRRIAEVIDHPAFQRLRQVRQLGPIHLVYPGAVHTRFEHSLGVYDMAGSYLRALRRDPNVDESLTEQDILCCLLAALLHDIGHYPFAHSLEAVHLPGSDTPRHEDLAADIILGRVPQLAGERSLGAIIEDLFPVSAQDVADLITQRSTSHGRPERRLVASIISSGIDADKADYLERDSLHMGVPYGRHFDRARLTDSLCTNVAGDRIAVTSKGRVSAETFIFSRYTMFSEAYWHHTVRAVSCMVEHALTDYRRREQPALIDLTRRLLASSDDELLASLAAHAPEDSSTRSLLSALTASRRDLYKRVLTLSRVYDDLNTQNAWERIYHLDRPALTALCAELATELGALSGLELRPWEVLVDTPPRDKDRLETIDVISRVGGRPHAEPLDAISRIVQGVATDFVKVVKRIRVFVHPRVRAALDERDLTHAVRERLLDRILAFNPEPSPQQRLF